MKKIKINRYKGNTHYSIHVIDSYGTEHHLGYERELNNDILAEIEQKASDIWANEVKPKEDLLGNAIKSCIELYRNAGIISRNRDGLD